jgi:hypothetical protein
VSQNRNQPNVWIFHGDGARFASGVFGDQASALAWVARWRLTGIVRSTWSAMAATTSLWPRGASLPANRTMGLRSTWRASLRVANTSTCGTASPARRARSDLSRMLSAACQDAGATASGPVLSRILLYQNVRPNPGKCSDRIEYRFDQACAKFATVQQFTRAQSES